MVKNCCICKTIFGDGPTLHRFPKVEARRQQWLIEINKQIDNFTISSVAYVCNQHFSKDCFQITLNGKISLKLDAVPSIFNMPLKANLKRNKPLQEYNKFNIIHDELSIKSSLTSDITHSEISDILIIEKENINIHQQQLHAEKCNVIANVDCNEPNVETNTNIEVNPNKPCTSVSKHHLTKCGTMQSLSLSIATTSDETLAEELISKDRQIAKLQKKVKGLNQKCRRLQKRVTSMSLLIKHLQDIKLLSGDAADLLQLNASNTEKEIIKRHLRQKKKGAFPMALKKFAATLQFYSTKAYEYVRKTFLNVLPHPQTIRKWYSAIESKPGITLEALKTVKAKIYEAAANEKILYFSLTIDDMSIRESIEYVGDKYFGYVDYGINFEDNDNLPEATHACVLLLVCINGNWKIPVAYYFIRSLTGEERANIIKQVLASLHEIGAIVINITMDGTASNILTAQYLGANIAAQNLRPYFVHPQNVVTYISGFVARKVNKKIKCEVCKHLLFGSDNMSALQKRKCRGGLSVASNDVIKICSIAEKIIREYPHTLKQNSMQKMIVIGLSHVTSNIFDNVIHMFEQAPLQDHRTDMIKLILYVYFQLRLRHICASKGYKIERVRSKLTKLIHFKHQ